MRSSMRFVGLAVLVLVAIRSTPAHAGLDCNEKIDLAALHDFASGKAGDDAVRYEQYCLYGQREHTKQIVADCEKILARGPWDNCLVLAASLGVATVGKRDVFEWIAKQDRRPWFSSPGTPEFPIQLFASFGDPRAVPLIVATWKEWIPKSEVYEHKHANMAEWASWRMSAASALGALGGADEQAFLEEQTRATVDTHVRDACNDAAAKIAKRLAATPH